MLYAGITRNPLCLQHGGNRFLVGLFQLDCKGNAAFPKRLAHKDVERRGQIHAEFRKEGVGLCFQICVHADADICGISRQAAKIRMVELGFEAAVGTFTFVDGHYVPPHSYSKGAIARNQTFTISSQDAAIQRLVNPALRSLTQDGDYIFLENHYVFKAPLYVEKSHEGHLQLTPYARSHMDECCLVFDMEVKGEVSSEYYTVCYLNREEGAYTFEIKFSDEFQSKTPEQQKAIRRKEKEEETQIRKQMTDDPIQCLKLLMEWRKMSSFDLSVAMECSDRTIRRTLNGESKPNTETTVLMCLALNLPPSISSKLLDVFGNRLSPIDPVHQWYQEALNVKWNCPVEDARDYLRDVDIELS